MAKHTITLSALDLSITYSAQDNSPRGCHTVPGSQLQVGDKIVIDNYFHEITEEPTETPTDSNEPTETPTDNNNLRVSISHGNSKMGKIPSVSLPPVITCPKGAPCVKKCYAKRLYNRYPSVKSAYDNNLAIFEFAPNRYFHQIDQIVKMSRSFRFHVSGDIPTYGYFCQMVKLARENPHCEILAFTKQYDIVNHYITEHLPMPLPQNLHIIFSEWGTIEPPNPYNLPTAAVIFKGDEPLDTWKICGGNCAECACRGVGCWKLKNGETIAFYEH